MVGTWTISPSSCVALAGDLDGMYLSLGCSKIPVTGALTTSGTFTAKADGTYIDDTRTTGSANFSPGADCLTVSSVPVTCEKAADAFAPLGWQTTCSLTGGKCNCSAVFNIRGGIGYPREQISLTGNYVASGNTLMTDVNYAYCVSGDKLTLKPEFLGLKGAVVLDRQSSGGTSGSSLADRHSSGEDKVKGTLVTLDSLFFWGVYV